MAAGLTRSEQFALVGVGLLILCGVGFQRYRGSNATLGPPSAEWKQITAINADESETTDSEKSARDFKMSRANSTASKSQLAGALNLNTAKLDDLESLPGIGPVRAQDILAARDARGGFKSLDDLLEVKGIGEITLEKLRAQVFVPDGMTTTAIALANDQIASPSIEASVAPQPVPTDEGALPAKININTATAEELERIPGIGPALASRIINARERARFKRPEDLINVSGIGPKTFEKMRAWVVVE